jgi:hypothetical protein
MSTTAVSVLRRRAGLPTCKDEPPVVGSWISGATQCDLMCRPLGVMANQHSVCRSMHRNKWLTQMNRPLRSCSWAVTDVAQCVGFTSAPVPPFPFQPKSTLVFFSRYSYRHLQLRQFCRLLASASFVIPLVAGAVLSAVAVFVIDVTGTQHQDNHRHAQHPDGSPGRAFRPSRRELDDKTPMALDTGPNIIHKVAG